MILIGSARIDENGHATGGKAGDQKQKSTPDMKGEVAQQNFYVASKGWYILRAKNPQVAIEIAMAMIQACNNPNIGYNQARRLDIIKYGTGSNTPINCDCSSLVRQCVREAGIEIGNFTTANEANILVATGQFEKLSYVRNSILYTGDILVTKTKGHTVVVTQGENRKTTSSVIIAKPTLKKGSKGIEVANLQMNLNAVLCIKLDVDRDFGNQTDKALRKFQNDYMGTKEVDGIYGPKSASKMKEVLNER